MATLDTLFSGLSPALRIIARDGAPVALDSGTIASSAGVQVTTGLAGQALRLAPGNVKVSGATDATADKAFSIMAWVRTSGARGLQRIIGRENGRTGVALSITSGGLPQAEIRSTSGGYNLIVTGPSRIDEGQWHLIVATVEPRRGFLGIDTGGINVRLFVDGIEVRGGTIDPGIFGAAVQLSMASPVILGEDALGASQFQGDIEVAGFLGSAASASAIRNAWAGKPAARRARGGWGILLG